MLKKERRKLILDKLNQSGKVTTHGLSRYLKVSEYTVRRDLNELSALGMVNKIHGGALSKAKTLYRFNENAIQNLEEKKLIARKAVQLLEPNQVIIVSGGTTNFEFAKSIPSDLELTVYTYSLETAMMLSEKEGLQVIFIGGKLLKKAQVTTGIDVVSALSRIYADYCFLGTSALSQEYGLTEINYEVAQVKRAMINAASKTVSLCTRNKLCQHRRFKVCNLADINAVVSSLDKEEVLSLYPELRGSYTNWI